MREILFRGKRVDNGEWVEGFYYIATSGYAGSDEVIGKPCHMITTGRWQASGAYGERNELAEHKVIPESISEFTGLCDKNGKRVYEGDIVVAHITQNALTHTEKYKGIYEVKYHDKYCYFYLAKQKNNILFDGNWRYFLREIEVIGNIHDNPKLLEAE